MNESSMNRKIKIELIKRGWFAKKLHGGQYQDAGLPDVWGIYHGITVCFEGKLASRKTTKLQDFIIFELVINGAAVSVVRSYSSAMLVSHYSEVLIDNPMTSICKSQSIISLCYNCNTKKSIQSLSNLPEYYQCSECFNDTLIVNDTFIPRIF